MPVERTPGSASLIDVLDRILDKGIVFDAWVLVSRASIDLSAGAARLVVSSLETTLTHREPRGHPTVGVTIASASAPSASKGARRTRRRVP